MMKGMLPMLAVRAEVPPGGPEWVHEVKWDGMRVLADVQQGRLRLTTRAGRSATERFPELASLAVRYDDMLLDGEVCVMERGRPSFAALSDRIHVKDRATAMAMAHGSPVTYIVFDLLRFLGTDLVHRPWQERRALLERLDLRGPRCQVPSTYDDGAALFAATAEQGLEGVVSKRRDAPYRPGRRSDDWIKAPHRPLFSVVVGGWRPEQGDRRRIGSLLVGTPTPDGLHYLGRVGSGLAEHSQVDLLSELRPRQRRTSPFAGPVGPDQEGTTWVDPEVVVDVRALGFASQGALRQPSYQRLRPDMSPEAIALEIPDTQVTDYRGGDAAAE